MSLVRVMPTVLVILDFVFHIYARPSIALVVRDTSCGLLDLSGTRRSVCYKTLGKQRVSQ